MKTFLKIVAGLICAALLAGLCACSGDAGASSQSAPPESSAASSGAAGSQDTDADGPALTEALSRAPRGYDFAVSVKINPLFLLFFALLNIAMLELAYRRLRPAAE